MRRSRPGAPIPDPTFRRLCRARDLVHAAPHLPLDVERLAREAGLSPYHFLRLFHATFGETPHAHVTRVRIASAKALLMRGEATVTEACFSVGFSSLGSFSSLFRREVGVAPSRYQRDMRVLAQVPDRLERTFVPACFLAHFAGPPR